MARLIEEAERLRSVMRWSIQARIFSGDAGYTLEDMLAGHTDGVTNNPSLSLETINKIREFATMEPTIVLPAHDPDAPRRLKENEIVR